MNLKVLVFSALAFFAFALLPARGVDIVKFPTDKEAIDHYLDEIQKREPVTAEQYYALSGMDTKDTKVTIVLKPLMWVLDKALKNAGPFRSVKVIKVLQFGPMVRHAQYLVTYENNVLAADLWFVNSSQGWQLVLFKFPISDSVGSSVSKVPPAFQSSADGF